MYPVSPEFIDEIRQGATIITTADVYRLGEPVDDMQNIPVIGGSLTVDPNAEIRRRCTIEIDASEDPVRYVPAARYTDDYGLWPAGNEINLKQSIKYANGALGQETVNLGWYQISRPVVQDDGKNLKVTLEGWDFSRKLGRAGPAWTTMWFGAGTYVVDGVIELLMAVSPLLSEDDFDFSALTNMSRDQSGTSNLKFARVQFERGDNVWVQLAQACRTMGLDLEVTVDKKVRLRPIPYLLFSDIGLDPTALDQPVATYEEGEYNIIERVERSLDDSSAYNGVLFIAENSSNNRVRYGVAWDKDLLSPTYFDPANPDASAYGPYPKIVTDRWTSNEGDPYLFAYFEFLRIRGIMESVQIDAFPMFCHEPYDLIRLKRSRAGVDDNYLLENYTLGLGPGGSLQGTMRSRRITR